MRPLAVSRALLATCALLVVACARPPVVPGAECELNTDCDAPLVCRLGRCRVECRAQRDCGAGLECVRDETSLGACQIRSETECMLSSDCPDFLVCRFERCTNACEEDRDCPPGARCLQEPGGARGCRDQAEIECEINSDCVAPLICATDERCRPECRDDTDCRDGRVCATEMELPVCVAPEDGTDGGLGDGGITDGGVISGDGGMAIVPPPQPASMAGGADHSCAAVDATANLFCWGSNASGQVGDSTDPTPHVMAHAVGPAGITVLGAGASHSCAASGSTLQCWGGNLRRQLGTGSIADAVSSPAVVSALTGTILDLSLGREHTCALTTTGLHCWGDNTYGQLGDGSLATSTMEAEPVLITGVGGTPVEVSAGADHTCVRLMSGAVECFGRNDQGQLGLGADLADHRSPQPVPGITDAVQVATGLAHTCVLRATGAVDCFGSDGSGQRGDGPADSSGGTPTPVVGLSGPVLELALGSVHACARTRDDVFCWGDNLVGQLGLDFVATSQTDVATATSISAADEIQAGDYHTCIRTGAAVSCFGRNTNGQLGNGDATTPAREWEPQMVVGL